MEQKLENIININNSKDQEMQKIKKTIDTLSEKIKDLESKIELFEAMKASDKCIEKSNGIICELCKKSFNNEKGLRLHTRKVHKEITSEDLPQLGGNTSILLDDDRESADTATELLSLIKEDDFNNDKILKDNESACLDLKIISISYEKAVETVSSNIKRLASFNFDISSYKDDEQNDQPNTSYIFFSEIEKSEISKVDLKELSEGWNHDYPSTELREIKFRRIIH